MKKIFVSALVALCGFTASYAQQASFLSNNHCLYRISQESQNQKCLLLPVQESAEIANIKVIADNKQVKAFNVKAFSKYPVASVGLSYPVVSTIKTQMASVVIPPSYCMRVHPSL